MFDKVKWSEVLDGLDSPDPRVRAEATLAIHRIVERNPDRLAAYSESIPSLIQSLRRRQEDYYSAAHALHDSAGALLAGPDWPNLLKWIKSRGDRQYWLKENFTIIVPDDNEVRSLLLNGLCTLLTQGPRDHVYNYRKAAAVMLGFINRVPARDALIGVLRDSATPEDVIESVALALARLGIPGVLMH